MNYSFDNKRNPISLPYTDFKSYLEQRKNTLQQHLNGHGIPDYAYAMDYELRRKLDAMPGFYNIARKICATVTSRQIQNVNQNALAVSPNQFPEVYEIGKDCAKILGIGVPNIYILGDSEINAYTYACDDTEPIVVINSGLFERMTPGELRFVIGHECGHIHNNHAIYNTMAYYVLVMGATAASMNVSAEVLSLLLSGAEIGLQTWSRAAEVTCDRAGMICAERPEDAYSALAKFMYGAAFGEHEINYKELEKQLEMQQGNIARLDELYSSHPVPVRRIMAGKEFEKCDLLYQWRPELRTPGTSLYTKEQVDHNCQKYISVIKGEK